MKTLPWLALAVSLCVSAISAQTPGKFSSIGPGCASQTPPALASPTPPVIGKVMVVTVTGLPANASGLIIAGESDKIWNGAVLPLNLGFLGGANCTLYSSAECLGWCATGNGSVMLKAGIPNVKSLIGRVFYAQFWVPDAQSNPAGFAMSNGGKLTIGG